jgi:hypothetical protein
MDLLPDKRNINADKAIALLKAQGVTISQEEAALVVDFLYLLAEIVISETAEV